MTDFARETLPNSSHATSINLLNEALHGRYQIQQQLGRRAGRRTFLARDLSTQAQVVLKLLSFGNDFEWHDLKLFEREAEVLKTLSHPAIPQYLDYFELDLPGLRGFVLVQTYVSGKTLEEHLKAGRSLSEAEVKQIAKDLLEILVYLHGQQPAVVHRDIKPSNVLLGDPCGICEAARSGNSPGQVYLVDFGSVQNLAAKEGGTITVVGTYGYMPPEQFGGRTVPASDLYGLGATLIYLVTGKHPSDLPQQNFRLQFESAANISSGFASWLKHLTEPSLEKRFASAQKALDALGQPSSIQQMGLGGFAQPAGSQISLTKQPDFLEVLIPGRFSLGQVARIALYTLLPAQLLTFIALQTPELTLLGLLLLLPLPKVLFSVFGRIRLRIDQQHISTTHELFGFKFRSKSSPRQNIRAVHLIQPKRFGARPKLVIWTKNADSKPQKPKKYELRKNDLLDQWELKWLADEISAWLGLPLTRK
ncbi:MAG: serine/threonine protein kinase [Leptolyngbyaceae cyanobacterium SM1_4_3]|nr:serine/threonine protein kinase [Leptolyngbyaceae cyanobacterium SM1_4_3]